MIFVFSSFVSLNIRLANLQLGFIKQLNLIRRVRSNLPQKAASSLKLISSTYCLVGDVLLIAVIYVGMDM